VARLEAKPCLGGLDRRIGDNRIVECADLALVSVARPLGDKGALEAALRAGFSLALPEPGRSVATDETRAVWMAEDQTMLILGNGDADAEARVQSALKDAGYTTDQTGGWVILEVSGPDTLSALERICPIDLDASSFPDDAAARTLMEHLSVLLIHLGPERFWLTGASSSAASLAHALDISYRNVT